MAEGYVIVFFKQKTAYEIYQCDWSSDVCSSDLEKPKTFKHPSPGVFGFNNIRRLQRPGDGA